MKPPPSSSHRLGVVKVSQLPHLEHDPSTSHDALTPRGTTVEIQSWILPLWNRELHGDRVPDARGLVDASSVF